MLKELVTLKKIGKQKIYEDTHISLKYIEDIITENYKEMTKIQFMGFISILQREYNLNLSTVKDNGLEYFNAHIIQKNTEAQVYAEPKNKINFMYVYIGIAVALFALIGYKSFDAKAVTGSHTPPLDNTLIEDTAKKIVSKNKTTVAKVEMNSTVTKSIVTEPKKQIKSKSEIAVTKKVVTATKQLEPLVITPRSRVWIGYINKTDGKKKQQVTKKSVILDPNKVWLLSFGHGHVNIKANGKVTKLKGLKHVGLLYKNGKITILSNKEFKKLNKGRLW